MEAFEYARHLDHAGRNADPPSVEKPKAATTQTPHGTSHTDDVQCSTCLPHQISRSYSSCFLQRHVYGTAIPHGR